MPFPSQTLGVALRTSADPAANVEVDFTADCDMIVHSLVLTFVTDATVANRGVRLKADDGTTAFFETTVNGALTASSTTIIGGHTGAPNLSPINGVAHFPLPSTGLRLRKGDHLKTDTINKQAGDNYSAMVMSIERI